MAFGLDNIAGSRKNSNSSKKDVTDALLNDASKKSKTRNRRTEYVHYEELEVSELNTKFSKSGIEELADQIYKDGLDQPLVVVQKENGKYEVLGGERRYLAIGHNIKIGRAEKNCVVEVKIKHLDENDLPLSDDDKRMFTWLTTNQYREKTDNDKMIEALRWKHIISKLREKGETIMVVGYDGDGNPIEENIAGKKTRQLIAEKTNMSESQVQKIETIENNGSNELKAALEENKVNIATAATISKLPKEQQDAFVKKTLSEKETISKQDVENIKKNIDNEKETSNLVKEINISQIKQDLDDITKLLEGKENVNLPEAKLKSYNKCIKEIKKILG